MSYKVEKVCEPISLGEGPHWDEESQSLYFVDITKSDILKYKPSSNELTRAHVDNVPSVSVVIPVQNAPNKFVISTGSSLAVVTWDGIADKVSNLENLGQIDEKPTNRMNDGKADAVGRIWIGSMHAQEDWLHKKMGSLFSYEQGTVKTHVTGVSVSNGLAWNTEGTKFYYIDTYVNTIDEFDCDLQEGRLSNRKSVFTPGKHGVPGFLDGQTADAAGNLWAALFSGNCVVKVDPRKPETLLQVIKLPAKQVTSVAFGGPNLDELYVTTARVSITGKEEFTEDDGALFKITGLGVKGLPMSKAKV